MAHSSINAGVDFLYALLHVWWANSAQGERLMTLARSATEDNFLHQLQTLGILTVSDPHQVQSALILRQHARLCKLAELAGSAVAQYVHALLASLESENFKALLNYRFFPEREGHLVDFLIPFPGECTRDADLVALLDLPTLDEFMKHLRPEFQSPEYYEIARQLEQDQDIMRAECSIDNLNIKAELRAIGHLPFSMQGVARRLLSAEIDTTNVCTLLRNANFYHMNAKRLSVAWIEGGTGSWFRITGVDFGKNASALAVTAMPPTNCMLYAVLDDPKGPVAARIRMEIPEDGKALVISAPIQAEGIHDLYLISDGDMKIYSWTVRE